MVEAVAIFVPADRARALVVVDDHAVARPRGGVDAGGVGEVDDPRTLGSEDVAVVGRVDEVVGEAVEVVVEAAGVANVVTFLVAAIGFLGLTIPGDDDGPVDAADDDRRVEATGRDGRVGEYVAAVLAGVDVVAGSALAPLLGASLFANFLFGTAAAVLPAYADALSDATAYGTLLAVLSAGRVLGSVAAPAFEDRSFASSSVLGFAAAGVAWVGGVAASGLLATAALFGASRIPVGVYNVNVKAVLQTGVPNDHLGRATATIGTASAVVAPFGMLAGGALGDAVSPTFVLYASGAGFALTAAYWLASPTLRRFGAPTSVEDGAFALAE